jgi:hypothetical protein
VKTDPENPEVELYSAIVDTYGPNGSVQIVAPMTVDWSPKVIAEAASLGFSIIDLAVGPALNEVYSDANA